MSDYSLSQTVPISELPRDYLGILKTSQKKGEPVILLRHNKPVGALVAEKVLNQLMTIKRKWEEETTLRLIKEGEKEFRAGKTTTKLP
ncbi:type II toxin-antitoxin system Phd/YefM family antitoxin [Patescibacteria group bacterium]|nr:type II toxin-antitoxin system Phd/YefM family antitoxin [Patescibacteria group bacterium]MBU1931848.1 type II toxin-antitoxin system Phd/YefM family antitoxin [Patescibacteria group bacterium]